MNQNPRHARSPAHGNHAHHGHHHGHNRSPQPRAPMNSAFPKPPSQSHAPWEITQWVDPIQAKNPKLTK